MRLPQLKAAWFWVALGGDCHPRTTYFPLLFEKKARKACALEGTTAVVNSTLLLADVMSGVDPVPQDPLPGPPPSVDQLRFKIRISIIKKIDLRDKKDFARV